MNAIPGFQVIRWKPVETLAVPLGVIACAADACGAPAIVTAASAAGAAVIHAARLVGWRSWRVGNRPILWILHVVYGALAAGFALLAVAALGLLAHTLAMHALALGAIGIAIIAMVTRTALGHTTRPLTASTVEKLALAVGRRRRGASRRTVAQPIVRLALDRYRWRLLDRGLATLLGQVHPEQVHPDPEQAATRRQAGVIRQAKHAQVNQQHLPSLPP
jgi:uncharacterized protein involved in response to NO